MSSDYSSIFSFISFNVTVREFISQANMSTIKSLDST